jgi:hypothetical protein
LKFRNLFYLISLIALLPIAEPSRAQENIGIYFDSPATVTNFDTTNPNEVVMGWLVLKDVANPTAITGFQAKIEATTKSGFSASVYWSYVASAQNFDNPPLFNLWYQTPLPWATEIVLASMTAIVPDPAVETEFHISAYIIPDILEPLDYPVYQPTFTYEPGNEFAAITQVSGNNYLAAATINDDGVDPGFPDITRHVQHDNGGGMVVGETLTGAFRFFTNNAARTLQAQIITWGGMEIQEIGDMYHRFPVLHEYTDAPVWAQLPVAASVSFQWRITPDTSGPFSAGYQLIAGGQVLEEETINDTAYLTPCYYGGHLTNPIPIDETIYPWYDTSPVDGIWEFGVADPGQTKIVGSFTVRNRSLTTDIEVFPQISGSSAFRLEANGSYPLTLGNWDSHFVYVIFQPSTPGPHTATLDFGPDACETLHLVGGDYVADTPDRLRSGNRLDSIHPNPFNPVTTVAFDLAAPGLARLTVYDIQGRLIARLADEDFPAGRVERVWTGKDSFGKRVASGSYVVRFEAGGISESRTVTLLK